MSDSATVQLRASRVAAFEITVGGVLFLFMILIFITPQLPPFTPSSWEFGDWFVMVVSGAMLLPLVFIMLVGLYWVITPSSLLLLDATRMVYQPLPFFKRTIYWVDIDLIEVVNTPPSSSPYASKLPPPIKLRILIKPQARSAYHGKAALTFVMNRFLLNIPRREFLTFLRQYHEVSVGVG
jgi:hypothetical protein